MNIEKPVLTREQAERLEERLAGREEVFEYDDLVIAHALDSWLYPKNACFNDLSIKDFATAVYYGYEVEQTPEEAAKQYFDCLNPRQRFSARNILDILDIKIEGINKEDPKCNES
ncbi:hypothetical protein HUG15_05565 [Salicibibacter cibarius]|uniref:Uncharacterized protein n=1 Tax=Salicibibacter cibarius TaxID=2743000 RepID=A0A7T7CAV8_9BACI|nr:hypothetical protein [Salicibibacter cibarius]QQK75062.1 hypothetical protein HUG15_05230 [Salicibibacter cibarius]QQK75124.1 hypothetical protein HUG15_05565 [Salicibibacter cibarius]